MLSDNGSPYIAKDTRIFARQLGLKPCYTPVKSPQSNGISEAFVNTFKRDYIDVTPLPDAATVLALIAGWFEDYNEVAAAGWVGSVHPEITPPSNFHHLRDTTSPPHRHERHEKARSLKDCHAETLRDEADNGE